ncbi:MAG: hypothetical protein WDO71_16865 [Bacteroidota bacterium]
MKKYIFPIVKKQGLVPISADDVIAPGDNWMAKISALISRAEFIVIDIATKNTMFELGLVMNQKKLQTRVLIIKAENSPLPTDLNNLVFITRADDPFENIDIISEQIDNWFRLALEPLKTTYDEEPRRLLNKKEYKAAVISAMTLLEVHIRQRLEIIKETTLRTKPLPTLFNLAVENQIINDQQYLNIREWSDTRNKLVHTKSTVTANDAKKIVKGVYEILGVIG